MAARRAAAGPQVLDIDGVRVELTRKRVRNVNLRVRRDGTVALSAPPAVGMADLEALVRSRRDWILAAQERLAHARAQTSSRCDDGATVVLWGVPLTVRIEAVPPSGRRPTCTFSPDGGDLCVHVDARLASDDEACRAARERLLDRWLQERLVERVRERLPVHEQTVGRRCGTVRIKHMKSRWGSCNVANGTIALSAELVHHPPRCLDYVIVHELCHLFEPSHNDRFHALMDRFYPTWRTVRAELNGRR